MSDEGLFGLAGVAAVVAGVLRMAATFTGGVLTGDAAEVLYAIIDTAAVFGIVGIYLRYRSRLGGLGIVGFAVGLGGAASIVGPDGVMFGVPLYMAGSVALLLGLAILGGLMLRVGVLRLPATLFVVALGLAVASLGWAVLATVSGLVYGLGMAVAGVALVREAREGGGRGGRGAAGVG
jgi:hypothetical protein